MTPNITKSHTDTSKFIGQKPDDTPANDPHNNPVKNYNPPDKAPALSAQGAIGSQFTADGAIGSIGQKVGGPFDKDGAVGQAFEKDGAIGGTINKAVGGDPK